MILEPISIATGGYIGVGPSAGTFCPWDIAIATDGYVRLDVAPTPTPDPFGGGHGAAIREQRRYIEPGMSEDEQLAILAVMAIEEMCE